MRQIDPAAIVQLLPVQLHFGHALAERAVGQERGAVAIVQHQRAVGGGGAQPLREVGGNPRPLQPRAAAIDDQPVRAVADFDRAGGGAASFGKTRDRRRRGIDLHHGRARRNPLIAPVARLPQRAAAHPAGLHHGVDGDRIDRARTLPATQPAIAMDEAEQRWNSAAEPFVQKGRYRFAADVIDSTQHGKRHHRLDLRQGRARYDAAIGVEAALDRALEAGFAENLARRTAGDQHRGRHDRTPGDDARQAHGGLVGNAVEMPGGAGNAVEDQRAIDKVAR